MKNLQNIIGGEKNFLFSDKNIFALGNSFLEGRKVFITSGPENAQYFIEKDDEVLTDKENTDIENKLQNLKDKLKNNTSINNNKINKLSKNKTNQSKLELKDEDANGKIDKGDLDKFEIRLGKLESLKTKVEKQRKQFVNVKLAYLYKDWSEQVDSNKTIDGFRSYLEGLYGINQGGDGDLDLSGKTIDTSVLLGDTKVFANDLNKLTKHPFTAINMKINYSDFLGITDNGKDISSSREENSDSTLNRATEMVKKMDFSKLFESEGGIIAAGAALAVLWKTNSKLAGGVIGSIAAIFGFNKITDGGFLDFLGKERDSVIDQLKSNDFVKRMDKQLNLTDNELPVFTKISNGNTETYLNGINTLGSDNNTRFNKLVEIAKGEDGSTEIGGCPKGMDQKYYASTLLKIFVNKGGVDLEDFNEGFFDIEQNVSINSFNSDNFGKGYDKFYSGSGKNKKIKFTTMNAALSEQLKEKPGMYSKIVDNFEGMTDSVYKTLDENGTLQLLNENIQDLENVLGGTVLFKYEGNGKYKIFSSKENGTQELSTEIIDGTIRIIGGSIGSTVSSITWMFGGGDYLKDGIDKFRAIQNIKDIEKTGKTTNKDDLKEMLPFIGKYIEDNSITKDQISLNIDSSTNKGKFTYGTKTCNKKTDGTFEFS